jgi:acetyl-CoA carboxylase carboxyltransferase component/biotin carboxyl carrier protein
LILPGLGPLAEHLAEHLVEHPAELGPNMGEHMAQLFPASSLFTDQPLASRPHQVLTSALVSDISSGVTGATGPDAAVRSTLLGTVVWVAEIGTELRSGSVAAVIESMKMEHEILASHSGIVIDVAVSVGATVADGESLLTLGESQRSEITGQVAAVPIDLDQIRPDLQAVFDRHQFGLDERRPDMVNRRRATGQRTARENINELIDEGSLIEYAPLVFAAQKARRSVSDLIERTPGDGMVAGLATVNAGQFGPQDSRCVVMTYDYTVLAGTQGLQNHRKKDRLFSLAAQHSLPVVLFAEGGGGRPGDTDGIGIAGLDGHAFRLFAELSGLVPLIGITSGYCFAGNAALLGCCDVVIATRGSNIGMGGPAMIEGGGLGVFAATDVGPYDNQCENGVIDVEADDEQHAIHLAKQYLSYFQGRTSTATGDIPDQRILRHVVPENRLRAYDMRAAISTLCDSDSVLELRCRFGIGIVTALARIDGRPIGVIANNPNHLGGAIDPDGADKASRFMQLCDAYGLPIVFLCDTPGFMVGPDVETKAQVRHAGRLFVTAASLTVPIVTVVLRKGYGLGAMAMAGGGFRAPMFTVAWPTGEFGGMGLEGAVRLGYRKELEAISDPEQREARYHELVGRLYEHGSAINASAAFEIDDVIDPADTRRWVTAAFDSAPVVVRTPGLKRRPMIDTW